MENQVQSLVYIDGEWVTRSADVYQIISRNQQQEDTTMQEPDAEPPREAPSIGILSRTIIETPFTKFILPANIRHKDSNDVVLIGEHSIQLKEICDYGHLRHVTTKSDFKGKILAARMFGDPRKVKVSTFEQSPFVHRARRSATSEEEITLPPEIIVLTLNSRVLVFLWATHNQKGSAKFVQMTARLPPAYSLFDKLGPHLAVDPKGRAIAVAAYEGRFILYKTKMLETWRQEARAGSNGLPIIDEAIIQIEGRIMHMEFLSSGGTRDDSHVVLVFLLVHEGKTKIARYEWDLRGSMDESTARKDRSHVDFEDRSPSLFIPLSKSPDFLLVCDQHISLYKRVLSGPPDSTPTQIPAKILPSLRPGESKRIPRWVQWDRATRNPDFDKEAFYIAREDGAVMYVERGSSNFLDITDAGCWPTPIDTAFACLNNIDNSEFSQTYPDVLISGGAGSDGLLCKVGSWPTEYDFNRDASKSNAFTFLESIPSWAPLTDMTVSRLPGARSPYERERPAIFVTNGKGPEGEVSELRIGFKAVIDDSSDGMTGCTGLWIVDYGMQMLEEDGPKSEQHYVTFISTLPPETIAVRSTRIQSKGYHTEWVKTQLSNEDGSAQDHIIRAEETIAACCWSDKFAIQITRKEARVLLRPTLVGVSSISFPHPLLGATTKADAPVFVISYRDGEQTVFELVPISTEGTIGTDIRTYPRHDLLCDPTCIEMIVVREAMLVLVGTIDGHIRLFEMSPSGSLTKVYEARLAEGLGHKEDSICESAVLRTSEVEDRIEILCGSRDGYIFSFTLRGAEGDGHYDTEDRNLQKMGSAPVQLSRSATDPAVVFVACGPEFCRLRGSLAPLDANALDSVWLVDQGSSAYMQGPVTAFDQLPLATSPMQTVKVLGGFMFAVSGDQMVFAQLDYDAKWSNHEVPSVALEKSKVIPRNLPTGATPMKTMYIGGALQNLVVATMENKEEQKPPSGYRTLRSSLKFIRMHDQPPEDESEVKQEDEWASSTNRLVTYECPLQPYERVHSMVEWTYEKDKGKTYHLVIVGTGTTAGPGKEGGRRLFFNVGKPGSGIKLMKAILHRHPVQCLAMVSKTHLASIIGVKLRIYEYTPSDGMWNVRAEITLPSKGVHLTVSLPFIYVSTAHDSHLCYAVSKPGADGQFTLIPMFSDSRQRSLAHHLVYDFERPVSIPTSSVQNSDPGSSNTPHSETIILLADKTCSVTGLFHKDKPTIKTAAETLFEACLPRSVIRLQRADIRPPWRQVENKPGILADDIVGACTDGTIYSFSILGKPARRVLRLFQNIIDAKQRRDPALRHTAVKHRSSDIFALLQNGAEGSQDALIKYRDIDPEVQEQGLAAPRFNHVDGDLLIRFVEEDGDVKKLFTDGCENDVWHLFRGYVRALRGQSAEGDNGREDVEWVVWWLKIVLMPLL
ncbi:hypothetical protein CC80DRAFT_555226 [Byssothecium circinans]|uniref:RSE1/DDB1/CPSF1 first beta-propeller domain-containing protein n=1 Tax=Byssothecium circinans TaxID=147558 RepID=A0A6A5TBG1_9PLEO|nr:hypothetical protein CC80DRAFT_555226 [Byssothecium circinans]